MQPAGSGNGIVPFLDLSFFTCKIIDDCQHGQSDSFEAGTVGSACAVKHFEADTGFSLYY